MLSDYTRVETFSVSAWGASPDKGMQDYLRRMGKEYVVLYHPNAKKAIETAKAIEPEAKTETAKRGRKAKGE